MRYFITGATGFIGLHLCRQLIDSGQQVTALVRTPAKAKLLPKGVETLRGDLSLFLDPDLELPPFDVVVHLAGVVAADTLAQYRAINFQAVADLIACLKRQSWTPQRFLFASSLAACGPSVRDTPWTEADTLAPIEPYGEAKAMAEELLPGLEFPTTAFRPPLVFGPGDPASLTLFRSAASGVGMRVSGAPQQLSFVDVRDQVRAIVLMAEDTRDGHFTYFTSHPEAIDIRRLWRSLEVAVGRRVWVFPLPPAVLFLAMLAATATSTLFRFRNQLDKKQYRQMVAPAFVCSSAALRGDLGWDPQHDLDDALQHAADGYREAGLL